MFVKNFIIKYKKSSDTVRASIWYTFCNVISKGFSLLTTPVFTRLLTEEEYGTFAIFQSWFNILIIFTSLNIFLSGYTKGLLLYKGDEEGYTSASLMQTTCITLAFMLFYFLKPSLWTGLFDLEPHLMVGLLAELLLMPAIDFWAARMRFEYRYKQYVVLTLSMSALGLLSGVIAVVLSAHKLEARVYADVITKAAFAGIVFILVMIHGKKCFQKEYWLYNFKFNLPLIPHYLSNYVLSQSDRLMIGKMVGKGEAGIYSVAYTISTMMNLITMAINNALTPFIYKAINNNEPEHIKKATRPIFGITAGLCVLTMSFAPEIILLFGGKNYLDAIYVIPPISASVYFIFVYAMFSTIEYYYQKTFRIALATTFSAALNLALNYIFIKQFGYYAAGYTTLVCYIILSIMHYIFYRKVVSENLNGDIKLFDEKIIFLTSIAVVAVMLLMVLVYQFIWMRYSIIVILLSIAFVFRKTLMNSFLTLKK